MSWDAVGRNLRVLVIDDNRAIHEDFRKILGRQPHDSDALAAAATALFGDAPAAPLTPVFELDSAYQGQEGVASIHRARAAGRPYALAFVDVRMPPGWDGIETTTRIWAVDPEVQIVICTAHSDYSWSEISRKLGYVDRLLILKKPFDNMEVLQLASALTEKWRVTRLAGATIQELEQQVTLRSGELQATLAKLTASLAERERTEVALRASEDKFSKAFHTHPDAISITRLRDNVFLEVNAGFLKMTGYAPHEVLGRPATADQPGLWVNADDRRRLLQELQQNGRVTNFETNFRRKDGSHLTCAMSAGIMEVAGEKCMLAVTRDLTIHRRLEEQLAQARKMEAVGQLAGGVAHDYNNILTATMLQIEHLQANTHSPSEIMTALDELQKMAQRSANLTRQLLTFSRRQVTQIRTVEFNDVVVQLLQMLGRLLGENIRVNFRRSSEPLSIEADVGMIEQVVTNLCVNARDAMMPRGGQLTIAMSRVESPPDISARVPEASPGTFACLTVEDTGSGMDPATLAHIFEPFFTTKGVGHGTGLGLATVYGITKQHRGWIEVESEVGRGSTFRVYFPAVRSVARPKVEADSCAVASGHETILLVEDESMVRRTMALALRKKGHAVLEAADGVEALRIWGEHAGEIRLLLSDMVMPNGLSGLDLAGRFKLERPDLSVIIASGYSVDLHRSGIPTDEGVAYLAKPFDFGTLTRLVRKCLDRT